MSIRGQSPYRIFLVLTPFRSLVPRLNEALAPLSEIDGSLPGVEGYYDEATDAALLCLQFRQRAVELIGAAVLIDLVADCGLPIIAADELAADEREAFYGQHLHTYGTRIQQFSERDNHTPLIQRVVDALSEYVASSFDEATVPDMGFLSSKLVDPHASEITASDYEILEIRDNPEARASSRWEMSIVRDVEDTYPRPDTNRPSSQWELVL